MGGITLINIKAFYLALEIKTVQCRYIDRQNIDKRNRIGNPHNYAQYTVHKCSKTIQWKKDNLFNKWCQSNWAFSPVLRDPFAWAQFHQDPNCENEGVISCQPDTSLAAL